MKNLKNNKSRFKFAFILLLMGSMFINSGCNKDRRDSSMTVKMVDGPGDYDNVFIEVLRVEIKHEGEGWIDMPTKSGIYDLLTLQNNVSATLNSDVKIPPGRVNEMRLVLGSDNTIVVDGIIFPLDTPSAEQSGLKFKLDHTFKAKRDYLIIFDFDVYSSIVEKGNASFSLKPVIKVKEVTEI